MSTILQKISSLALGDLVSRGLGFITSIYLARILGPEGYGIWTTALAILSYMLWFSDLGIMQLGTREIAKSHQGSHKASDLYYSKLIWGLLVIAVLLWLMPRLPYTPDIVSISQILLLSLVPYAFHLEWMFSGKQEFATLQIVKVLQASIFFFLVIFGLSNTLQIERAAYFYGIAITISAILLWIIAFRKHYIKWQYPTINSILSILSQSIQLGLGWLATQVIILFPPLVFAYFYTEAFVGLFGAALRILLIVMMIDRVLVQILLPNLSKMWSQSSPKITSILSNGFRFHSLIGLYGTLAIIYLAPYLIALIYGSEYQESTLLLQLLSIIIFFTFQNSIFATSLIAMDAESNYLKANVLGGSIGALILVLSTYVFAQDTLIPIILIGLIEGIIMGFSYYYFRLTLKKQTHEPINLNLSSLYLSLCIGLGSYIGLMVLSSWSHELISMLSFILTVISSMLHKDIRSSDIALIKSLLRHEPQASE